MSPRQLKSQGSPIVFLFASLLLTTCGAAGLFDRGQDLVDAVKLPVVKGHIRIEVHVLRLDTRGRNHHRLPCDSDSPTRCDPMISGFIDTERPNHDFGPDSAAYSDYTKLFDANNEDMPIINKQMSRDICGATVRKVAVRFRAIDKDMFHDDKIDNYKCFITGYENQPAANERNAWWSKEMACPGEDRRSSKVFIKYRNNIDSFNSLGGTVSMPTNADRLPMGGNSCLALCGKNENSSRV